VHALGTMLFVEDQQREIKVPYSRVPRPHVFWSHLSVVRSKRRRDTCLRLWHRLLGCDTMCPIVRNICEQCWSG
jgi:hypothetical protein